MSKNWQWVFFDQARIDSELLKASSFVNALHLIEKTIANPFLAVKFSQTCVAELRNEPLYDLTESKRHIPTIYSHLSHVLEHINLEHCYFKDKWSSFTLGNRKQSSFDVITFDSALVNAAMTIDADDIDSNARFTLMFYGKLLHGIAHASLAELGRRMTTGDYDDRFSSPATHALTGEAGNAIERHFFGSVIEGCGHYLDDNENIYMLDNICLCEKRNKKFITKNYLRQFVRLKFAKLTSIPMIETENLPMELSPRKKRKQSPASMKMRQKSSPSFTRQKETPERIKWSFGMDMTENDDDDDLTLYDANGNPRRRVIAWKE